jgi:beta-alanine degradation protein BauB
MKKLALIALAFTAALVFWRFATAQPDDLDPLKAAPDTHKLAFENAFVRVLEVRVPPGKTEPLHSHPRRIVVYLSDFNTRTTVRGGKPEDNLRTAGLVRWSEPLVHTVENIGQTEGHVISVELK